MICIHTCNQFGFPRFDVLVGVSFNGRFVDDLKSVTCILQSTCRSSPSNYIPTHTDCTRQLTPRGLKFYGILNVHEDPTLQNVYNEHIRGLYVHMYQGSPQGPSLAALGPALRIFVGPRPGPALQGVSALGPALVGPLNRKSGPSNQIFKKVKQKLFSFIDIAFVMHFSHKNCYFVHFRHKNWVNWDMS